MNARGLERVLRQLATVPSRIAGPVADAFNVRIDAGFSAGTDPYGAGWADLAPSTLARGRFPPPLTDTRALRSGTLARPSAGAGVELVSADVPYASRHMTGDPGASLPARPYLPNRGLPAPWRADVVALYREAFGKTWAGGR